MTAATRQGKWQHGKRRTMVTEHSKAVGKSRATTTTTAAAEHGKAVGKNRTMTTMKHGRTPNKRKSNNKAREKGGKV